ISCGEFAQRFARDPQEVVPGHAPTIADGHRLHQWVMCEHLVQVFDRWSQRDGLRARHVPSPVRLSTAIWIARPPRETSRPTEIEIEYTSTHHTSLRHYLLIPNPFGVLAPASNKAVAGGPS